MRHALCLGGLLFALSVVPVFAQGPGGVPGAPMPRLGRSAGQTSGLGVPGAPMARMGRGGAGMSQATATRRSSGAFGVQGVMTSQSFRASNMANQARGAGMQRSSASLINGATRGASRIDTPR